MVLKVGNKNLFFELLLLSAILVTVMGDYNCEYKKDGFYSDDDFCHIYWRCNYGVAEEYECPAGTAWNHVEMRCDWLDNVDCSRIDETKKEDDDEPEVTTKKSKKKTTTASDDETTTPVDDETTKKLVTNRPNKVRNTTTAEDDDDDEDTGFDYNELCFNVSSNDAFRDDPFICNRYVRCNHGSAQKFVCTKATAWDSIKKMCTWISEVKCGDRQLVLDDKLLEDDDDKKNTTKPVKTTKKTTKAKTTKLITTSPKKTTSLIDTDDNNDKPQAPNSVSSICPNPGSYYVQDNSNCASYYMCNNGKDTKMTCPEKQLFNSETNQCEDSQQVGCGTRPASLNGDKTQCTSKRDGIYPDMDRGCRIFFQCVKEVKTREAACPNGLKFNSVSAKCENPANILAPCGTYTASSSSVIKSYSIFMMSLILISKLIFN